MKKTKPTDDELLSELTVINSKKLAEFLEKQNTSYEEVKKDETYPH